MNTIGLFLIIIAIVLVLALIVGAIISFFILKNISHKVYEATLVRTSPEKWSRTCSAPDNPEHLEMWNRGCDWGAKHQDIKTEVEIDSEGFHLVGEYFDFGSDKAVIIIPGRSESLIYSYYFAPPYEKAGCNILVIDIRSHGNSSGTYDYVGGEEVDILKWAELLHERFGNKQIIIHGICMGANTGIMLLTKDNVPSYITGIVSEGCYISFEESYAQHMRAQNKPVWPVLPMVMHELKKNTGCNVKETRPIDHISKLKTPLLMLCGKKDIFSLPQNSQLLYDKCGSQIKEIVWFEEGAHSHLRIANEEKFDAAIADFIQRNLA